jgi:hypothetical protein
VGGKQRTLLQQHDRNNEAVQQCKEVSDLRVEATCEIVSVQREGQLGFLYSVQNMVLK